MNKHTTDIIIQDSLLAKLVKLAERNKASLTFDDAAEISAALDDLRLQQKAKGMDNNQFYRWLDCQ